MSIGTPVFSPTGTVLTAVVVAWLLLNAIGGPRAYRRLRAAAGSVNLVRFYSVNLAVQWLGVALALAVLITSPGLTAEQLGLALPSGPFAPLAVGVAVYFVVIAVLSRWRTNRRVARGRSVRMPTFVAAMLPRTGRERRLAFAMATTAGIAEEILFRGLLITAGVGIAGLPVQWAAVVAAALFAVGHLYQGLAFVMPTAIGLIFTATYLYSGSLLPGMVAHMAMDIAALTLPARLAARPGPVPEPQAAPAGPGESRPAPEASAVPVPGMSAPSTVSSPAVRPPVPVEPDRDHASEA